MIHGIEYDDLFVDIETGYNTYADFGGNYKKYLNYKQIIREREIISISWSWGDEKAIHGYVWDYSAPIGQRDKDLLALFVETASSAGRIIAQNGVKFDIPWIRTRNLLTNGSPLPEILLLDPLLENRRWFNFNSNSQDYLSRLLLQKGKIKMELEDWIKIVEHNDSKALAKMLHYNKDDVSDMRKIFKIIQPHIPSKSSKNSKFVIGDTSLCTACGGATRPFGTRKTNAGLVYPRWRCLDHSCDKTGTLMSRVKII